MNNKLIAKSFLWMAIGLLVTFVTGYLTSTSFNIMYAIFTKKIYIAFIIIELLLVLFLSIRVHRLSPTTAKIVFLLYSFISGLTFSAIFLIYKISYITYVFFIAAFLFGSIMFIGIGFYTVSNIRIVSSAPRNRTIVIQNNYTVTILCNTLWNRCRTIIWTIFLCSCIIKIQFVLTNVSVNYRAIKICKGFWVFFLKFQKVCRLICRSVERINISCLNIVIRLKKLLSLSKMVLERECLISEPTSNSS